ncbi:hypothetical protein EH32_03435 [Erythrobacter litoralis]|jgi:hypothetical protein|uniref:Flagellar FliJ protein n=1 Tax=Erythrobacter litoralis TaxID=39960 RepID=A0A074MCJ1_9SPHN|nr:hypothetical protein [Erythrobacter litoralis]KEO89568.1 hypothetical protein EH32_03435 [Erythrobacter litoralis]MEE4337398.1 hypothetical protein [Erythrobacter sp.]
MRERRRLALAKRQLLIAQIAQRQAMRGLADALGEETRSRTLVERSRSLLESYSYVSGLASGEALTERGRFLASLSEVSAAAERAEGDAARQAEWQADVLAKADTRMRRFEDRTLEARRALETELNRRAASPPLGMARKLLKKDST